MRLGYIQDTAIECSPLFLLLMLWMAISGQILAGLTALGALALHELAHWIMAKGLGCRVESIELQPFGFVARMERAAGWDGAAIAAAGPLCSLLLAMGCAALGGILPLPMLEAFGRANLSIALLNLLPALPLDGGRLLEALLRRYVSPVAGLYLGAGLGALAGCILLGLGFFLLRMGEGNGTLALFGLFLLIAALREPKRARQPHVEAMLRRHRALRRGGSLRVVHVGVHKSLPVSAVLRRLQADAYTVIDVLDDDMRIIGQAEEPRLLAFLGRIGGNVSIGEALRIDRGTKG